MFLAGSRRGGGRTSPAATRKTHGNNQCGHANQPSDFFNRHLPLLIPSLTFRRYGKIRLYALVAQWIERYPPEVDVGVRVAAGAPFILTSDRWISPDPSHPPSPRPSPLYRANSSLPFPLPVLREGGRGKSVSNIYKESIRGVGGWDGIIPSARPVDPGLDSPLRVYSTLCWTRRSRPPIWI